MMAQTLLISARPPLFRAVARTSTAGVTICSRFTPIVQANCRRRSDVSLGSIKGVTQARRNGLARRSSGSSARAAAPLEGVKVLELASVLAGPSVAQFLAELGADVVKVENKRTRGDVTRGWCLPGEVPGGITAYFSSCNVGKRSVVLDAGVPRGRELCQRLAASSDIVIASYKPGDAEKLGVDAKSLRSLNPKLIYAQITGYGLDDPRVGYDALIQAEAGFTFMNGQTDAQGGQPTKMPVALVDLLAAHQLKEAILLAMLRRERSGEGAHVHVSLAAAAVSSLANQATGFLIANKIPQRMGSDHPSICPYGTTFADREGQQLVLAVGSDSQFRSLCQVLGCPELGTDERFAKNVDRVKHREMLCALITEKVAQCSRAELLEALQARSVPAGAIADMSSVFEMPQAQALVHKESDAAIGLRQVAWLGDGVADHPSKKPPRYAQHTAEVFASLGLTSSEVAELAEQGVIDVEA